MLHAQQVKKSFGDVAALRGVDLDVEPGQIISLLGRNGAGKTTLLSIVAGLVAPDEGTVHIDGIDVLAEPNRAAQVLGIAPQETGIYPVLTVRENLHFFCDLAGVARSERRGRSEQIAERLDLGPLLERKGNELSGGEARRLHTACSLVHQPKLLMLDEPTVGADVATRQQLIEAVKEMADDGAAVVYTTHYLPEVEALGADIVIIDDGQILARGTQEQLIAEHHLGGLRFTARGGVPSEVFDGLDIFERGQSGDSGDETEKDQTFVVPGDLTMAGLLARFGDQAHRLVSVERNLPDLETVFLAVTGNDLAGDDVDVEAGH